MDHVVQSGETLRQIAHHHGLSLGTIIGANPDMHDPDRLFPGQRIQIPVQPEAEQAFDVPHAETPRPAPPADQPQASGLSTSYRVQAGDTLKTIAVRHGTTLTELIGANPDLDDPDAIRPGQLVSVPIQQTTEPVGSKPGSSKPNSPKGRKRRGRWAKKPPEVRVLYVMERLTAHYGYPINGAAGIVGNLFYESGVLPNRIEGSRPETPMRAKGFDGVESRFSAREVMNRNPDTGRGPVRAGIGLAQWTSKDRRRRLFEHEYQGGVLGAAILRDMNAQIDFLVTELRTWYQPVERVVAHRKVTVDDAADEVLYDYETPASVIGNDGKLDRSDPAVRTVLAERRELAHRAREIYSAAHPATPT